MSSTSSTRVDAVAREVRDTVDPAAIGGRVFHWSIPNLDATNGPLEEPAESIQSAKLRLTGGEVLISRLNPRKARVVSVPSDLSGTHVCSGEFVALQPVSIEQRFLTYVLSAETTRQSLDARVQSVTRSHQRVRPELITQMRVPSPPLKNQRRIADFLDAETARIDALIAAKQQMTSLLEERHAIHADQLLAPSPADGLVRLASALQEVDDRVGPAQELPTLLSVSIHHGVLPFSEIADRPPRADSFDLYKRCAAGDIVINRLRAFQGGVGVARVNGMVSPDYLVLRPLRPEDSEYLHHLMRSPWFVGKMTEVLRGIGEPGQGNVRTPRVNWKDLRLILVPDRSPMERDSIAASIARIDSATRRAVSALRRQIELLQERRQALITAAVTGELEV